MTAIGKTSSQRALEECASVRKRLLRDIEIERRRLVEGYDEYDYLNVGLCYVAPKTLWKMTRSLYRVKFDDLFPWDPQHDERVLSKGRGNKVHVYNQDLPLLKRCKLLVKGIAAIRAEYSDKCWLEALRLFDYYFTDPAKVEGDLITGRKHHVVTDACLILYGAQPLYIMGHGAVAMEQLDTCFTEVMENPRAFAMCSLLRHALTMSRLYWIDQRNTGKGGILAEGRRAPSAQVNRPAQLQRKRVQRKH